MNKLLALAVSGICAAFLQGCGGGARGDPSPNDTVAPPPNEQWTLVPAAEVGMDGAMLQRAINSLPAPGEHLLASMLVLRHGKPVVEQYWSGYTKDSLHDMRSATKSITSLMVGIAIDKGMLAGVDQPISTHLAAGYAGAPALGHNITLKHLLTMSSGLACNDKDDNSPGQEDKMYRSRDWVQFFLNLPALTAPGGRPSYCTGGVVALGRVISEASKRKVPDFADAFLFGPLQVAGARWADFDEQRQTDTGGHLRLRPRDMAKIGQLVLQKGKWNGVQLVSESWIAQSTGDQTLWANGDGYGYLWWRQPYPYKERMLDVHFANGNGGQLIFVVPELDLVAVFTGENYNSSQAAQGRELLRQFIIPSVL
ncbi:serine hydrolase domain-containing protein [Massilia glaciei]|uniref:Serine hydrolase n=1 Tax=Massilia glaciei TaxID=1524097 RepID=A0A2U2HM02_9BURK|nr:serine hydrolase [Massilia glaciei]PWF48462.1 serine hydrolase [Massilia glaciei]